MSWSPSIPLLITLLSGCAGEPNDLPVSESSAATLSDPIHQLPPGMGPGWNTGWDRLDGYAVSDPALVSLSAGRHDAFVYGSDNKLWWRTSFNGSWAGWALLDSPATLVGRPVAIVKGNRILVFVRYASDLSLHARYFSVSSGWSDWDNLGGALNSDPAVAIDGGYVNLVALGTDNRIYYKHGIGAANWWDNWYDVGSSPCLSPPSINTRNGVTDIFAVFGDRALHHRTINYQYAMTPWESLGGSCASVQPAVVATGGNTVDVVLIGTDNGVYHKAFNGTSWVPGQYDYDNLHGAVFADANGKIGAPTLTSPSQGSLELLVQGTDRGLYHKEYSAYSRAWTNWVQVAGCFSAAGQAAAVSNGDGSLDAVAVSSDRNLWHNRFSVTPSSGGAPFPECPMFKVQQNNRLLFDTDPTVADYLAWGDSEFVQLNDQNAPLVVRYKDRGSFAQQTELLLLAQDPSERLAVFSGHLDEDTEWANLENGLLPAASMPFSPAPPYDTSYALTATLDPGNFGDEIHAMRVYKHGQCAKPLAIDAEVLAPVSDEFWTVFKDKASADGTPSRKWSHTTSFLTHAVNYPNDMGGGFLFNAYFYLHHWQPGFLDNSIHFNYRYDFFLDDGRLSVAPSALRWLVDGVASSKVWDSIHDALQNTLPGELHDKAVGQQAFALKNAAMQDVSCDPAAEDPCRAADILVGALVRSGGAALGLAQNEIDQAAATATAQYDNGVHRNYQCRAPDEHSAPRCEYILRAKRLNIFPDQVELVWFDGKELANPAYAAYLMTKETIAPDPSLTGQLCAADRKFANPSIGFATRSFAGQYRGPAE